MQQLQQFLWQLWQFIGWNGISALAALLIALDALLSKRRSHSPSDSSLQLPRSTTRHKHPRHHKHRRQGSH